MRKIKSILIVTLLIVSMSGCSINSEIKETNDTKLSALDFDNTQNPTSSASPQIKETKIFSSESLVESNLYEHVYQVSFLSINYFVETQEILVPYTDLYVSITDDTGFTSNQKIYTIDGGTLLLENNPDGSRNPWVSSINTDLACLSWFAGSGALVYVEEVDNELIVYRAFVGEGDGEPKPEPVFTLELPQGYGVALAGLNKVKKDENRPNEYTPILVDKIADNRYLYLYDGASFSKAEAVDLAYQFLEKEFQPHMKKYTQTDNFCGMQINGSIIGEQTIKNMIEFIRTDDNNNYVVRLYEDILDDPKTMESHQATNGYYIINIKNKTITFDTDIIDCEEKANEGVYSKYQPIVVDSFLLGGYDGEKWINNEDLFHLIAEKELYTVYRNGRFAGAEIGNKIAETQIGGGFVSNKVELPTNRDSSTMDFSKDFVLAISSTDNPFIREPERLNAESSTYKDFANEIAAQNGHNNLELQITDLYRFDIEGDGVDEVIVNANAKTSFGEGEVFGSVLFLRKIVDGKVVNIVVNKEFYTIGEPGYNPLITYTVLCFSDFNNDGNLEIVLKSNGIDHLGYSVYELHGEQFKCVLSTIAVSA